MRCEVRYSPEFLKDLFEIGSYIESRFQDPEAADRITNGIVDATDILAENTKTGARIFLPGGLDSGYHFVTYRAYLAVYRVLPDGVYVARAIHEKQDYMRALFSQQRPGSL